MTPQGAPGESLTGSTEKRGMETAVEEVELTSMSLTQADWQFGGITVLNFQ